MMAVNSTPGRDSGVALAGIGSGSRHDHRFRGGRCTTAPTEIAHGSPSWQRFLWPRFHLRGLDRLQHRSAMFERIRLSLVGPQIAFGSRTVPWLCGRRMLRPRVPLPANHS